MKIISPWDYVPYDGHICSDEILVEPDQAYSIKELLIRAQNGTMPPLSDNYDYDDDVLGDEFNDDPTRDPNFDFADANDLANNLHQSKRKTGHVPSVESDKQPTAAPPQTVTPDTTDSSSK